MDIAIPMYDRFTALDAIGPYEVLSRLPDAQVTWLAHEPGLVRTDNHMLAIEATAAFEDLPAPDVDRRPRRHRHARPARGRAAAHLAARRARDVHVDDVGLHRLAAARRRRDPRRRPRDDALARARDARRARRDPDRRARRLRRQDRHRGRRLVRHRHGPRARGPDRRRPLRPGDPAAHRVRPPAAVRRGLDREGRPGPHRPRARARGELQVMRSVSVTELGPLAVRADDRERQAVARACAASSSRSGAGRCRRGAPCARAPMTRTSAVQRRVRGDAGLALAAAALQPGDDDLELPGGRGLQPQRRPACRGGPWCGPGARR